MEADFVIIGAGSAGCVLANRLSADPRRRVLLLEAGPASRNPWHRVPAAVRGLFAHKTMNWRYYTQPEPHLDGRRLYWPRGKMLGGSSAINGMGYVRGHPADYDHWRQLGATGWSWDDVAPIYRSIERYEDGDPAWHGSTGELSVERARSTHPVSQAFVEAAAVAGLTRTADFNTDAQEGSGYYRFSIDRGLRHSAASAFLDPIRSRPNLVVVPEAQAEKILFDGLRATGVAYWQADQRSEVRAGEVIVAAGSVNAPQLLMLSGIGPGEHLRDRHIAVVADRAAVGRNLQDHIYIHHLVDVGQRWSSNGSMRGFAAARELLQFALRRRGLLSLGASSSGAFIRSDPQLARPDLQLMFKTYSLQFGPNGRATPSVTPGVTTSISHVLPQSRGHIELATADFRAKPLIFGNYLAERADADALVAGLRWSRRIFAQPPLDRIGTAETAPGPDKDSDGELLAFVRAHAQSMYHPVGTCRMGADPAAVVDARLRVVGVERLRVADASIMPTITAGNTNAPAMMIGAKAAAMILEDAR